MTIDNIMYKELLHVTHKVNLEKADSEGQYTMHNTFNLD